MQLLPDEDHEMRLNGDQQNSSTFAQMHFGRNLNCPDQLTIRRRTQVPHGLLESQATKGQYPSSDWGIRVKTTLTEVGSVVRQAQPQNHRRPEQSGTTCVAPLFDEITT